MNFPEHLNDKSKREVSAMTDIFITCYKHTKKDEPRLSPSGT